MTKKIKKYYQIILISIQVSLEYRAEMILWFAIDALPMIAMVVLWMAVYSKGGEIGGYSLENMLTYYLSGYFISSIISAHFEEYWIEQIRKGQISNILLKPYSFKIFAVLQNIAWKITSFILVIIPIAIGTYLATDILYLPSIQQILILIPAIFIGFILDSVINFMIIAFAFIFGQAHSLSHLKWMTIWIFSGSMIPFELLPNWLYQIAIRSPFQHLFTTPVKIYLGDISLSNYSGYFIDSLIWLAIFIIIQRYIWNYSIKKYTAVGN